MINYFGLMYDLFWWQILASFVNFNVFSLQYVPLALYCMVSWPILKRTILSYPKKLLNILGIW